MKPIAVLYATREGHTQQVAEHVAETLRRLGFVAETRNLRLQAGGDTDTSRDYDYTDWAALDRFVEEFATEIPAAALQ